MNWIATYYDIQGNVISEHEIHDRNEHEAEHEAIADMPWNCDDWSLMKEDFYDNPNQLA